MTDHAEHDARVPRQRRVWRARQVAKRGLQALTAKLWSSFWLIVIVAVIMASLVALGDLSVGLALASFGGFVAAVLLLPHQDTDQEEEAGFAPAPVADRNRSPMSAVVDALPDPGILLSPTGQVVFFNAPAKGVFSSLREGSHISSLIRAPEFLDAVSAAPQTGQAVSVVYAERVPVGRRMEATVAPLGRKGGPNSDILVLLRDFTEGDRINQMRTDFIANASHEMRTPLASLRGFIETLQSTAKEDEAARERFLPIMAEQAARMTRLIDALLSLSRLEMNAHVPPSDLVDLNDVLGHARDTLEPIAADSHMTLEVERFAKPAIVRGDRDELLQVLQNLVQNALKYGRPNGSVRIEAKHIPSLNQHARGRFAISVIDNGPGISAEHLPRLTERFYRVDVDSSREKGGTGLGLAIVKHILNRHRGELAIASKPEQGSTFTVMLNESQPAGDRASLSTASK
ncbi:ATP-binding protein [Methyloceanibacter sp. wino2]|uniref:ATP-binding protein n=1 Tax=Methyloceanibacter sp. wino2 TaxID=2170729 RepID=UPI000D3ECA9F|nr:ATP-binding protein [Methyloceanibacter sp. wino2]